MWMPRFHVDLKPFLRDHVSEDMVHEGLERVTVRGRGLILSIVHLPPLTIDSPFTFTVLIIFFADTFQYIVW